MLAPAGQVATCAGRASASGVLVSGRFLAARIVPRPSAVPYSCWTYRARSSPVARNAVLRQLSCALAARGMATSTVTTVTKTKVKAEPKSKTATSKPKAKATKRKPAAKKKAAPKKKKAAPKKKKPAKILTPEETKKAHIKELKKADLKEPSRLPHTGWTVFFSEKLKNTSPANADSHYARVHELAAEWKGMSSSQISVYVEEAAKNKVANEANLKAWVEKHTPQEIAAANHARKRIATLKGVRTTPRIPDERQPKKPMTSFSCFISSRYSTKAVPGASSKDTFKSLAQEWRGMSEEMREPFKRMSEEDIARYATEVKSVLGRDIQKS